MTLGIGEIIAFALVMGVFGGTVGWAASVGRTGVTKALPPPRKELVAYEQAVEPEQLTQDEADKLLLIAARYVDDHEGLPSKKAEDLFKASVGIHRAKRENRRIKK